MFCYFNGIGLQEPQFNLNFRAVLLPGLGSTPCKSHTHLLPYPGKIKLCPAGANPLRHSDFHRGERSQEA